MSYSIWYEADLGGPDPVEVTMCSSATYNLAPIFREALNRESGLLGLDEWNAHAVGAWAQQALDRIAADRPRFEALAPANGWGTLANAIEILEWFVEQGKAAPRARLRVR